MLLVKGEEGTCTFVPSAAMFPPGSRLMKMFWQGVTDGRDDDRGRMSTKAPACHTELLKRQYDGMLLADDGPGPHGPNCQM